MPDYPNTPITRDEQYLANVLGENVEMPTPITREEKYLYNIAVNINTGGGVTPADNGKVVVNGQLTDQTATTKTANGTYDTTTNNSVTVAVPIQQSKSVTIDEAGTVTITPDSGYEAMEEVVVTAEVPSVSTAALVTTFADGGTISGAIGRTVNSALVLFRSGTGSVTGVMSDGGRASLISETYTGTTNFTLVFARTGVTTTVSVTDGAVAIADESGVTSVDMYRTTISYPS